MAIRQLFGGPLVFSLALVLVLGCGTNKTAPAEVSGKVTYKGEPVAGGTVWFHTGNGVYSAQLDPEGNYRAVDLPVGEMTVTVETERLNPNKKTPVYNEQTAKSARQSGPPGMSSKYHGGGSNPSAAPPAANSQGKAGFKMSTPEGAPGELGHYVQIPSAYADKTKSPLKATLQAGSQTQNFDLKD